MRGLAALVLTLCLLVSGCGGDHPQPAPSPTKTPSPSETTPTPPEMPEAVGKKTKAGAVAQVRYFLQAMAHAGATGDTTVFKTTYTNACTRCEAIATGIADTYSSGGSIDGGAWQPTRITAQGIADGVAYIDAIVTFEAQTLDPGNGKPPTSSKRSVNNLKTFQLKWSDGGWRVAALDPEA